MAAITRQKGDEYFRAGSYGFTSEFMDYVKDIPVRPERTTITGRTLLEGKVVHVPDVQADPDYTFSEAQRLSGDPRTFLGVPLLREGNPVGALVLLRRNHAALYRQADRTGHDLRRPGRNRYRERPSVRRSSGQNPRTGGGADLSDRKQQHPRRDRFPRRPTSVRFSKPSSSRRASFARPTMRWWC